MKKILQILMLGICSQATAQTAPAVEWKRCYGGTNWESTAPDGFLYEGRITVRPVAGGGYIFCGSTGSNNGDVSGNHGASFSSDYWVVRLTSTGAISWQKALGSTGPDAANDIRQTYDGGFIVAGTAYGNDGDVSGNHGMQDFWVVKLSNTGAIQWQKSFGGSDRDIATSVVQTKDSGYVVAGYTNSFNGDVSGRHGNLDFWVIKLNKSGTLLWTKALGGTNADISNSVAENKDSTLVVCGYTESSDYDVTGNMLTGPGTLWITKLSKTGTLLWSKPFGSGVAGRYGSSIVPNTDNGYYVAGSTGTIGYVAKLDNLGVPLWEKSGPGSILYDAYSIQETSDTGCVVAGLNSASGSNDYALVKFSRTGTQQWQSSMGGTDEDRAYGVSTTPDGGYIIAGVVSSTDGSVTGNHGEKDIWLIKYKGTGITPPPAGITTPAGDDAIAVYPNPAKNQLNISGRDVIDHLVILNSFGQTIYTASPAHTACTVKMDVPGLYTVIITTSGKTTVRKIAVSE